MHLKASKKEKEVATLFSGLETTERKFKKNFDGGGVRTRDDDANSTDKRRNGTGDALID